MSCVGLPSLTVRGCLARSAPASAYAGAGLPGTCQARYNYDAQGSSPAAEPMSQSESSDKPWGGRFAEPPATLVERFTASVGFDQRLYRHDIACSMAHAHALAECGVLSAAEHARIQAGLEALQARIETGDFEWDAALEDVHMNIEAALRKAIGDTGAKLHTGRSRNDQVATDMRLYLKEQTDDILDLLEQALVALATIAEREAATLMPGMTHLQYAQPVTFGHHLLAWFEMLMRDHGRFTDCRRRMDECPLGAAALAGTSFTINRELGARLLGFAGAARNSMDAVSDRDFCIEFCAAAAVLMMHLSRIAEELVLWVSPACRFVTLPDELCTGSSIMPQKKNPDVPELVRGKTGRVYGHLLALLTLMKAQPLAYNRDNQEDKEAVFDTVDTVRACLEVYVLTIPALKANRERMREAAGRDYTTATDLADYLAARGEPFRDAHRLVGQAVAVAAKEGVTLAELGQRRLKELGIDIDAKALAQLTPEGAVARRTHVGGTAPDVVARAAAEAQARAQAVRARRAGSGLADERQGAMTRAPGGAQQDDEVDA